MSAVVPSPQSLARRIATALVMAPAAIAIVLLLAHPWVALISALLFSLGLWEWSLLISMQQRLARMLFLVVNLALMAAYWLLNGAQFAQEIIIAGVVWWLLAALWLHFYQFAQDHRKRTCCFKSLVGSLVVLPAWVALLYLHAADSNGKYWLLFVLLLVWCADIGAYFSGRKFGKTKLAPKISPSKTRAGAYGAMLSCVVVALCAGAVAEFSAVEQIKLIVLALATGIISIIGDLFESLIKRHANLKDSGNILPGHGGIFDRFDSLFAALPVFVIGKQLLGL